MAKSDSNRFDRIGSDSGVFVLDPEDQAVLDACAAWEQGDALEAEAHARFLRIARELPPVRLERILALRRQIAEGTYVTEGKIKATVDRLLEAFRRR